MEEHGNSVLLKGLKKITKNITTIVAMGDNGGGTGKLREDLRNALSNTEPEMEKLLNHRFQKGELKGQSFRKPIFSST